MPKRACILVIDDDASLLTMLRLLLHRQGYDVVTARDAGSALRLTREAQPDAILLDVMMPMVTGFELCGRLRELTDVPVLFLTASSSPQDVSRGFIVGADDYITKPFAPSELLDRLAACLRGHCDRGDQQSRYLFPSPSMLLDRSRGEVTVAGRVVSLTGKEFEVLSLLVQNAGQVLSLDAILDGVWGAGSDGGRDLAKKYIDRLRRKIEPSPNWPRYVHTAPDGYYFGTSDLLPSPHHRGFVPMARAGVEA